MGIGEAEAFSERLKRELLALEAANVHAILESEPLIDEVIFVLILENLMNGCAVYVFLFFFLISKKRILLEKKRRETKRVHGSEQWKNKTARQKAAPKLF